MSWQLDPAHSLVSFSVRHMMISKVKGFFENFEGDFSMDEENPAASTLTVRIDAASINTRNEQRDGHLRSADFLDAGNYPVLTFQSTGVEVLGQNNARLNGNLTIREITRPVTLDVEYIGTAKSPWGKTSVGFNASTTINRKDWNLTWNQGLETGGVLVGDEIEINIELELVKVAETQPASV
jgi:polyisoprenoid-binding protein YceI